MLLTVLFARVPLPAGDGEGTGSNSSTDDMDSVVESEPDHHIDYVSLGST